MQPVIFLSHDDPSQAVDSDHPSNLFLRNLEKQLRRPKAIVCVSAHWETSVPTLSGADELKTIHDFYGFPEAFYQLDYQVPGKPELAKIIQTRLINAGIKADIDEQRGIDHGAWCVLKPLFPDADIPTIQLSVNPHSSPAEHIKVGETLQELRQQDVLIIASGTTTHNLSAWHNGMTIDMPVADYVKAFRDWVVTQLQQRQTNALCDYLVQAPYAQRNHPTPEHFLPLFIALGATTAKDQFSLLDDSYIYGHFSMASFIWQ